MTRTGVGSPVAVAVATVLFFASTAAEAEEPKVEVNADVVLVSNQGTFVDPSLAAMKDTFSKEGLSFSSYKRLSSQKLWLTSKKTSEISLPHQQKATLKLDAVKQGAATVAVNVGAVNTTYTLGQEGSVFINFGHRDGGEMVLVLSPAAAHRPRRVPNSRPVSSWFWRSP